MYDQVCKDDLNAALLFFTSLPDDERGITVQCSRVSDIPYVKHNIRRLLGVPDRTVNNTLFYKRRPIKIIALSDPTVLRQSSEDTLFFVDVYPSSAFTHIEGEHLPVLLGDTLKSAGLYPSEIATVLKGSGISQCAIARCICE